MSLRQAATLGAAQTATTMALSFISVKVTSVFLGPAGLGTLGQFTYFITMTQAVLAAGLNIGLVRRTAELGDDRPARERVVSTVLRALVLAGVPVALVIAAGSPAGCFMTLRSAFRSSSSRRCSCSASPRPSSSRARTAPRTSAR